MGSATPQNDNALQERSHMKRSEINTKIKQGITFLESMKYVAPPFVYWSAADWQSKGKEYDEIRDCMLGWDITDFGSGDYEHIGLLVITTRNGIADSQTYFKAYAEKCLIISEGQVTPMHYHYHKMEDIINRGGANLIVQVYNADEQDNLAQSDVKVYVDGRRFVVPAGEKLTLKPGESITLPPRQYHSFWAEGGTAMVVEVSKVNDDNTDNHFLTAPARFPEIEEDEAAEYLLFSEYPVARD
jgi:D-lyxose ketol-isomerase